VNNVLLIAQIAASFATAAALGVAVLQWRAAHAQMRTMQEQLEQARERAAQDRALQWAAMDDLRAGENARNAFELVAYLERPEHVQARRHMGSLAQKPLNEWADEELAAGELVSGLWEIAASLERLDRFPQGFLTDLYGDAISRHWRILEPLVVRIRERTGNPSQRQHFQAVAEALHRRARAPLAEDASPTTQLE
jgi:hypothetical protein